MFKKNLTNAMTSLLSSEYIRIIVGYVRWFYFVKILNKLKTYNDSTANSIDKTLSHNLIVFDKFPLTDFAMKRMSNLLNAVGGLEALNSKSHFLIIGPRTESDILRLKGLFYTKNISAIDLITYSPWIKLQDMHELKFEKDQFDCIICGWTISYSSNPSLALSNMVNVVKNKGFIALGVEHAVYNAPIIPKKNNDPRELDYYANKEAIRKRLNSISDFEQLFKDLNLNYDIVFKSGENETNYKKDDSASEYMDNVMIIIQVLK